MATCRAPGCEREAKHAGLCHGHYHRKRRGLPMTPLRPWRQGAMERLRAAALAYADATSAEDYQRAEERLRQAARAFAGDGAA